MEVGQILGTDGKVINNENAQGSLGRLNKDFDNFLKLMITQMQNQDPTNPMDSSEFTQQIVSFTSVEAAVNTNKKLDDLIGINQLAQTSNLVSFTGKEVEVDGNFITLEAEGDTSFEYTITEDLREASISIYDKNATVVFSASADTTVGKNTAVWDGTGKNGERVEPGTYMIAVTTMTRDKVEGLATTTVRGRVTGVNLEKSPPTLVVNGEEIPLDEVKFIRG